MFFKRIKNNKGQAAIEFALTITIFLMMILGTVDIAKILVTYSDMSAILRNNLASAVSTQSTPVSTWETKSKTELAQKTFFSGAISDINVTTKRSTRNGVGDIMCFEGNLKIKLLYKEAFSSNDDLFALTKKVCTLQEVDNLG